MVQRVCPKLAILGHQSDSLGPLVAARHVHCIQCRGHGTGHRAALEAVAGRSTSPGAGTFTALRGAGCVCPAAPVPAVPAVAIAGILGILGILGDGMGGRWNRLRHLWKLEGLEDLLFALFAAGSSGLLLRRWQRPVASGAAAGRMRVRNGNLKIGEFQLHIQYICIYIYTYHHISAGLLYVIDDITQKRHAT